MVAFSPLHASAERITLICSHAVYKDDIILTFIMDLEKSTVMSATLHSKDPPRDDLTFEDAPLTLTDSEISWKWTYKHIQTNYYTLDRNTLELKTWSDDGRKSSLWLCRLRRRQL